MECVVRDKHMEEITWVKFSCESRNWLRVLLIVESLNHDRMLQHVSWGYRVAIAAACDSHQLGATALLAELFVPQVDSVGVSPGPGKVHARRRAHRVCEGGYCDFANAVPLRNNQFQLARRPCGHVDTWIWNANLEGVVSLRVAQEHISCFKLQSRTTSRLNVDPWKLFLYGMLTALTICKGDQCVV